MKTEKPNKRDYSKLELTIYGALEEADARTKAVYSSLNPSVEKHIVRTANDMLPLFPKDSESNGYILPLDVHKEIPAFVYYGERPTDIPKMVVVIENIASKPAYMNNCSGLIAHEIGHTLSWNYKLREEFKDNLEGVLGVDDVSTVNDVVSIISQIRAEAIAVDAGYEHEMLNIRKYDMKKDLKRRVIYENELENLMILYASFRLIENKTKDKSLKKEAVNLAKELDSRLVKKLKDGHDYHKWLKELTLWTVDSEAFKEDLNPVLKYCKLKL